MNPITQGDVFPLPLQHFAFSHRDHYKSKSALHRSLWPIDGAINQHPPPLHLIQLCKSPAESHIVCARP